ncbi:MAG: hypothetical protein U0003_05460 [Vampirovibrionales bacterium]
MAAPYPSGGGIEHTMILSGRISNQDPGLAISTHAMTATMQVVGMHTDNIANFGVPGYHRKQPVVTSFVEFLGANAVDEVVSDEIGRVRRTENPLDVALNTPGFFQKVGPGGRVELTRDGRMRLDAEGNLLSMDNKPVMAVDGRPIRLPFIPGNLSKDFTISPQGDIAVFDPNTSQSVTVARLSVVTAQGTPPETVDMRQHHVEDSNVFLQKEFSALVPLRRQFEANRQLFLIQSDTLSRVIQELGRAQ